jgi:hypothetical protein
LRAHPAVGNLRRQIAVIFLVQEKRKTHVLGAMFFFG